MTRSFHLLVNPHSGGGRGARVAAEVGAALRARGARVRSTVSPGIEAADDLVADTAEDEVCVAVGGDGMVSSVAKAVAHRGVTLGIAPSGRGNDFARQLSIPTDPQVLAAFLINGGVRLVDAIGVGDKVVVGSVYAGVDSLASQLVNGMRRVPGVLQYPLGALRAMATFPVTTYRVTVDGVERTFDGFTVVAANSGYYGKGMHIAPDADPADGLLDVLLLGAGSRASFIRKLPQVYRGTHTANEEIVVLRGREVRIEADGVQAYADGDPLAPLPVTATVLPGALRIIAPDPATARTTR
ncbi:diacylglycerol kinase family protein [Allobranchiibius sp. CTAmp26]|uniref:diacylglycerol/lipid kinase family protein n=1 Tax=Allobranchiibius sp. CTAmp26 TaxID=2815214 RepID=UPI001AA165AB|nr:diacylglycerol kinase family protein [Allobranchiibius sp. CTAmp26]MBO1756684.1 diacylglycerol kinase [Allobranchiibius sp. CTAmp26]